MRRAKMDLRAPEWRGFDWDAITPVCTTCGQKSGQLNDASTCPACRQAATAASDAAQGERFHRKVPAEPKERQVRSRKPRARPASRSLPDGLRQAVVAAYIAGDSLAVVAAAHHVGANTVRTILADADVPLRPRGNTFRQGSEELRDALVAAYRSGASLDDLKSRHGMGGDRVRRLLIEGGCTIRQPNDGRVPAPRAHIDEPALVAGYAAGRSVADLAAEHGVTPPTVRARLARLGVALRDDRGRRKVGAA